MIKHHKEIKLENSSQNLSLKFWFNQIFMSLEELSLEFRFDINPHMDPNSQKVLESVQSLTECYLEFIYYLSIFSIQTGELMPVLTYISDSERFFPFINLLININIYDLFENILLIKVKVLIQNCSYIQAMDSLNLVFRLFFKEIRFYLDFESPINNETLNSKKKKDKKRNQGLCKVIQKIILGFYLRGVMFEHIGYYKNSIKAYQQCRWFSNIFMQNFNKFLFRFFRYMERKYLIYHELISDIQNKYDLKINKKNENNKKKRIHIFLLKKKNNSIKSDKIKKSQSINLSFNKTQKSKKGKKQYRFRNNSAEFKFREKTLEKSLINLGKTMYKKEENRNNSVFNKFTTNNFVLSTVHMINNLLSQPFRDVLKKMDKIEITKPQEEMDNLINKTLNIKKRNEFREKLEKRAKIRGKRNKTIIKKTAQSLTNFCTSTRQTFKDYNTSTKQKINLVPNAIGNKQEIEKENNRYDEINSVNMIRPNLKISCYKNNRQNSFRVSSANKIHKFSPNKDVFSKSMILKKKYLNSFFEKELTFQKKLLKLKSYDMQIVSNDYNQQQVIRNAEQDFKIVKCFAESQNAKKNLINLVGENELKNWEISINNKLRLRANRKMNILNINNLSYFMRMNHIRQRKGIYEPEKAAKNNDEKTKLLTMECAKIEEMESKCQIQKEILRNQISGRKARYMNIYKIK